MAVVPDTKMNEWTFAHGSVVAETFLEGVGGAVVFFCVMQGGGREVSRL
jgi:hypothetical protein